MEIQASILTWIIILYFYLNIFRAGYMFSHDISWAGCKLERIWAYIVLATNLVFGVPIEIIDHGWSLLVWMGKGIDSYFQLTFYWGYIFNRKEWVNMDIQILSKIMITTTGKRKGTSLRNIIYRHAAGIIFKLNGYTEEKHKEHMNGMQF